MNKDHKTVVAISGGFDPIHIGHIRYIKEAKKTGDRLVVILNNDHWLIQKKGFAFMPEVERKEILEALTDVDEVVLSMHSKDPKDMSVCEDVRALKPDIFANGGDRDASNSPEQKACEEIGCEIVYGMGQGGKIQSSSWLLENFRKKISS